MLCAMTDAIPPSEAPSPLTPEQIEVLSEFADTLRAARRMGKLVAWAGGIATGVAVFAYYVLSVINAFRHPMPPGGTH